MGQQEMDPQAPTANRIVLTARSPNSRKSSNQAPAISTLVCVTS